jgi:hypothetical protein
VSAYEEICECKKLQISGPVVNRQDGQLDPGVLTMADCLTCGTKWLYNHILQKFSRAWGPEGRAWLAGYPDVASHENAQKVVVHDRRR